MPEEPDVSKEEFEVLEAVWQRRIETKKKNENAHIDSIADRILSTLRSRPDGMGWPEIRAIFDETCSDQQIKRALDTLKRTPMKVAQPRIEQKEEPTGERFLLVAG